MIKRILAVGLLSIVVLATLGVEAQAHYTYVKGKLVYHSLECEEVLKGVKNPDTNPSRVDCIVVSNVVETLCSNPAGNDVDPGNSATQVTVGGTTQLTSNNFNKQKGLATALVVIPLADDLGLTSATPGVCVNPNWNLEKAVIRSATATLNAYTCGPDQECQTADDVLASITTLQCSLSDEVGFDDFDENSQPINPILFSCPDELVSTTHVK